MSSQLSNITMKDVASRAQVSIKTVSRVVNNEGEISDETRQKVLATIGAMGYKPNLVARGLVTQRSNMIGLLIPDMCNPFLAEVARGVEDVARMHNYRLVISNTDFDVEDELKSLELLDAHGADGIVIVTMTPGGENIARFADRRPIVTYQNSFVHPHVGRVLAQTYQGGRLAMDYLLGAGHRNIGMIAGGSGDPNKGQRVRAYRDVLLEHGLPFCAERVMRVQPRHMDGYSAARQLLTEQPELTALFCYNDLLALGALRACSVLGRHVPADCAIVGFDDIDYASISAPALTTVRLDKREIGRAAMRMLVNKINEPDREFPATEIAPELIVRESA